MGLKQLIKQQKILSSGVSAELELPGEPLIYSVKYTLGSRTRSTQFFRNEKWRSLLRCFFNSYYNTKIPVVLLVTFYVSPFECARIKKSDLRLEKTPAVFAYELCDYLLSFIEMLHHVLINSYRQIVKIEANKFYSSNPRTVFKFMKWDHYVKLQANHSVHSPGKSVSASEQELPLQSERQGDAKNTLLRGKSDAGKQVADVERTSASDRSFQDSGTSNAIRKKTPTAKLPTPHEKARRRQSGKVSE